MYDQAMQLKYAPGLPRRARRPRVGTASERSGVRVRDARACGMAAAAVVLAQCHPPSSLLPSLAATRVASSPWIPAYCDSEGLQ